MLERSCLVTQESGSALEIIALFVAMLVIKITDPRKKKNLEFKIICPKIMYTQFSPLFL